MINACRRAHSYAVYNYPIILQILEKNLDHLNEEEQEQHIQIPQQEAFDLLYEEIESLKKKALEKNMAAWVEIPI